MQEREQPHDIASENAVLGTLIMFYDRFADYADKLSEDMFYYEHNKAVFRCIKGVIDEGNVTDINSLADYALRKGEDLVAADFAETVQSESVMTLRQDIERLAIMRTRRNAWHILQQAAMDALDPTTDADEVITQVTEQLNTINAPRKRVATFSDSINELHTIINGNLEGRRNYLVTGFKLLDEHYVLRPGTMTVIAAFTSVGKTSLAMNISTNVAANNIPVAYYSMEMGKAELAARVMAPVCKTPSGVLLNQRLNRLQYETFVEEAPHKAVLPIYIDEDNTSDFNRTILSIRTLVRTKGIRLAVIDYLQIYAQQSDNPETSLGIMARAAKNIATECGIAVILLSQLNRSQSHPSIKMLRGSGQIEESADNVILIDRPEAYPDSNLRYEGEFADQPTQGTAKLILAKGRGSGTGCSLVKFNAPYTRFHEEEEGKENLIPF